MFGNSNVCSVCKRSKTVEGAVFAHVRMGLDEPPEPLLCKCRPMNVILDEIMNKYATTLAVANRATHGYMDTMPPPHLNPVVIDTISTKATREVELRLSPFLAARMHEKLAMGAFGVVQMNRVEETGCCWWTGVETNVVAKARKRTNGESVVKVPLIVYKIAPGYSLAVSDEYGFTGRITHPQYRASMDEIRCTIDLGPLKLLAISRAYVHTQTVTYAGEFEFVGAPTSADVSMVLSLAVNTIGSVDKMVKEIEIDFLRAIRSSDHIVVDVPNMDGLTGPFTTKVDGVKTYVFVYPFGYIVALANADLTVLSCVVPTGPMNIEPITNTPDTIVAEMLADGTLVHIDTIAVNGETKTTPGSRRSVSAIAGARPNMIFRTFMKVVPSPMEIRLMGLPSDGIVHVTDLRTMRMKAPTIDLVYANGDMCATEDGVLIPITIGSEKMNEGSIYELDVVKGAEEGAIVLTKPKLRIHKRMPNHMDVVRRAVMSVSADPFTTSSLLDITSMSISMRTRVYEMARSRAPPSRKVIVVFGAGRLQEWRQMLVANFSYIVIDPEIDVSILSRVAKKVTVMPYNFSTSFKAQVTEASKRGSTVLWAKSRSEDFIRKTIPITTMSTMGIPAVFSFSISYHIAVIPMLKVGGVSMFGCGYVHDSMPRSGVGRPPVTMTLTNVPGSATRYVTAKFGKSTYVEPFLSRSAVPGLFLVKDAMPELWANVDANTIEIMERAVIMYA
jgi:DNA-directed RNA polymerase subunit K/omega